MQVGMTLKGDLSFAWEDNQYLVEIIPWETGKYAVARWEKIYEDGDYDLESDECGTDLDLASALQMFRRFILEVSKEEKASAPNRGIDG